jgi:hypothetical protein
MTEIRAEAGEPARGPALPPQVGAAAAEAAAEFPRKAADAVQLVVDTIHDKAIRPAVLAARAIVFGLVVAAVSTLVLILGSVALLRLLDNYFFSGQVWLSYIVLGGAITLAGFGAWSRRTVRPAAARGN